MYFICSIVGVDCDEAPPVPIPNTEVKLIGAEDTWLEAARENRLMPAQFAVSTVGTANPYSSLAQSVEHAAVNRRVVRSSRTGGAKASNAAAFGAFTFCPWCGNISLKGGGYHEIAF